MKREALALALGLLLALSATSPPAQAAVTDEVIQQLKDQIAALNQRIAELEQSNKQQAQAQATAPPPAAVAAAPAPAAAPAASWADKIALNGNFRYRYDNVDQEGKAERNRERIRAQLALVAKPETDIEVGFGLSTSQDQDPVSANQTIGNGSSPKDVYLNLAYFNWTAMQGLNVEGGKFKNALFRPGQNELLWDSDLNPEGGAVMFARDKFFANAITYWLESDSDASTGKAFAIGGQAGVAWPLGETTKLTAGLGYYQFGTQGKGLFYAAPGKPAKSYGNTVNANGQYVYDYNEIEGFAQLDFQVAQLPAMLFGDYVENTDPSHNNTGWLAGVQIGGVKKKGNWLLGYTYQDLQSDAVFGLWTNSDFGGGGTDNSGSVFRGAYALTDRTNVAVTYFINQIGQDINAEKYYDRLQLDLNFRY